MMEKIHEKFIDKIQDSPICPYYDELIEKISKKYHFLKENVRIVAFGLPKTGKTIFGNILLEEGNNIFAETSKNGFVLKLK